MQLPVTLKFFTQASAPFSRAGGITGYVVGTSGLLLYGLGSGGGKVEEERKRCFGQRVERLLSMLLGGEQN